MTAFGPQLIGATEKALNALLDQVLDGTDLTESQWVTLRLAGQNTADRDLATLVGERAHYADPTSLVTELSDRGLIADNRLSVEGRDVVERLHAQIATRTAPLWADLDPDDVAAAERILTTVAERARDQVELGRAAGVARPI